MKTRKTDLTGANGGNGERISVLSVPSCSIPGGVVEIDFNLANSEGVNIYPESFRDRDGDADFKFLARDTSPTYVDNPDASGRRAATSKSASSAMKLL